MSDDDHEIPAKVGRVVGGVGVRPTHGDSPVRRAPGTPCASCGHPRLQHRWGSRACRHITTHTVADLMIAACCGCDGFQEPR